MKKLIITTAIILNAVMAFAQMKTDTIKVRGNCDHCKERIEETSLKIDGVTKAEWDADAQKLMVSYDASKTNNDLIQQAIAKIGHDTEKYRANDKTYNQLPACCNYTRAVHPTSSSKGIQTMEFKITGMTCAEGCAKGIQNALYKQKGIKVSEVNYETQKGKVVYDPSKISKEQIITIVENFKPVGENITGKYKVIEVE
jgi:copper ion binding protein